MKVHLEITNADNGFVFETFTDYLKRDRVVYEITTGLSNVDEEIYETAELLLHKVIEEILNEK